MMPITHANPPYFSPHSAFTLAEVLWGEKYDLNVCDPKETITASAYSSAEIVCG